MDFFRLSGPRLWGDYGAILIAGMSTHLPRVEGRIQLERTGPFIPPITFPLGDVVVTDDFRGRMEALELPGIAFRPVIKARIVEYHWEGWDRSSERVPEVPEGGEPEDYVLSRTHSPEIAESLGDLWELELPEDAEATSVRIGRGVFEFRVNASTWQGAHLFRPKGKRHAVATEKAKAWLQSIAGEWINYQRAIPLD
jgi:hypothetical protein